MPGLFRGLRRRHLLRRPFPPKWLGYLERRVPFFRELTAEPRQRFLDQLKLFAWEKEFIGAGGFTVTDEVRVVVSATAVHLVVHLDLSYYDRLREVIVYPDAFRIPERIGGREAKLRERAGEEGPRRAAAGASKAARHAGTREGATPWGTPQPWPPWLEESGRELGRVDSG